MIFEYDTYFLGYLGQIITLTYWSNLKYSSELAKGRDPVVNYWINGNDYIMRYYLVDGIYPKWLTFVKKIPFPFGQKRILFAKAQEAYRKDVEYAFGVL